MGRWREPPPRSAKYITAAGYRRLNEELKYLWKIKRPEVTQAVKEAAAQGDRSENAEYIYGKKQLREIDRRVRYLAKRLEDMTVVDRLPDDHTHVYFGAWVTVCDEADREYCYRIVGPDEIDDQPGYISVDSPMARQLLKKSVGDEITLQKPDGQEAWYEVLKIEYRPEADS